MKLGYAIAMVNATVVGHSFVCRLKQYLDKNHYAETTAEALHVSSTMKQVNLVGISVGHANTCLNRIWGKLADIVIFDIGTNDIQIVGNAW